MINNINNNDGLQVFIDAFTLFKLMLLLNMVAACTMLLYQNHKFIIIQSHL